MTTETTTDALEAFYAQCEQQVKNEQDALAAAAAQAEAEKAKEDDARFQRMLKALPEVLRPFAKMGFRRNDCYLTIELPDAAPFNCFITGGRIYEMEVARIANYSNDAENGDNAGKPYYSKFEATHMMGESLANVVMLARRRAIDFENEMADWAMRLAAPASASTSATEPASEVPVTMPSDGDIIASLVYEMAIKAANIAINQHVAAFHEAEA